MSFERIGSFCYLWDMLITDGGCDIARSARVNEARNKFRELQLFNCVRKEADLNKRKG